MKSDTTKKERVGWYLYDVGNSAFSTTVVTVFLGPYLTDITRNAAVAAAYVYPLGIEVAPGSFFPYVVSLSVLLQVFLLPWLGALADYSNRKRQMLSFFAFTGAAATIALYFLSGTNYLFGGAMFIIANLCFGASVVFYNAYLTDIAAPENRDSVSSKGWAAGYLGGGLLLLGNLYLFSNAADFGLDKGMAARICLCAAGIWWGIFSVISISSLKTRGAQLKAPRGQNMVSIGFKQLFTTLRQLPTYKQTLLFLIAYLCYNDGVQTVITMASQFGQEELHLGLDTLTKAILMVQFVAFFGSLLFNVIAKWIGTKGAILVSLIMWIGAVVYAWGWTSTEGDFFILAGAVALVLGGTQALSRSLYSQMIPKGRESEYFSLYEISDRGTSWLGPLAFGLALQWSGSYRIAILSLIAFFVIGFIVLIKVNVAKATSEAATAK